MTKTYMMNAKDIMEEFGVGRSKAYRLIRDMNAELLAEGYKTISGKVPRPFVEKKFYGYEMAVT